MKTRAILKKLRSWRRQRVVRYGAANAAPSNDNWLRFGSERCHCGACRTARRILHRSLG